MIKFIVESNMKKFLFISSLILLTSNLSAFANPEKIDMTKWQYNSAENVFYQLGIKYCENPVDEKFEKLAVFVPAGYLKCNSNGDNTYSCKINNKTKIKNYTVKTAPIVMPINTPAYSSAPALTDYTSVWEYTNEGFIYVYAGLRGKEHGVPAGVTDLKAAVKYIKYNKNIIPWNVNRIFSFGMSGGGAQSVLLGATGDSKLYEPYLKQIGAVEGVSDSIEGSASWCPITSLDIANEAYEWNLGSTRTDLDKNTQKISDKMAIEFAKYLNEKQFRNSDGNLLELRATNSGIYQAGSYYVYLEKLINQSLTNFFFDNLFPVDMNIYGKEKLTQIEEFEETKDETNSEEKPKYDDLVFKTPQDYIKYLNREKEWVNYDSATQSAKISNLKDFAKFMKPATKPVGAFDGLERQQTENTLFGNNGKPSHFDRKTEFVLEKTEYSKDFANDFAKTDFVGNSIDVKMNMYNPLYFIMPAFEGYKTSKVAKHWRIRSGLSQTDTALTTEVNLSLALKRYCGEKNVDFETVWAMEHVKAERRGTPDENFIKWVNKCVTKSKKL